jgi:4-hydroxyphenylacetate 3-monooxygenase
MHTSAAHECIIGYAKEADVPLRTGQQYLEGLRDGRKVYLNGELVEDVTATPGLGELAHTVARLYDMQHEGVHADLFAFDTPEGDRRSRAWWQPRSQSDLRLRQRYTQTQGRLTGGMFGRLPEYVPLFHLGMLDVKDAFAAGDPRYLSNIERYFEEAASADRSLSHAFVDLQSDPSQDLDTTPILRVVRESESGIVVNGVKSIGTFIAQSDECLVGAFPRPGLKNHHIAYFSVPVNAPGVKVIARSPHAIHGSVFDNPVIRLGDENDAILVLDEVEVPWERVFQYGQDASFASRTFPLITEWAHWSILVRLATKAEVIVGLFAALPEMLGRDKRPDAQEWLGEVIRYLFTLRSFLEAAAVRGHLTGSGHFMPNPDIVTAGRCYGVEHYRRVMGGLVDLMGQGFINAPTEAALTSPEIGGVLREMFDSPKADAYERVRLTRFAQNLTVDGFGGRQMLFEIFNATGTATIRAQLIARFDTTPYKDLARAIATGKDLETAIERIESGWTDTDDGSTYDRVGVAYQAASMPVAGTRGSHR